MPSDSLEFRFIGTESLILDQHMDRFGKIIPLMEEEAERLVGADPPAPIIPPDAWQDLGITEAECSQWPTVLIHGAAPAEFLKKRDAAWLAAHDYRESVRAKQ